MFDAPPVELPSIYLKTRTTTNNLLLFGWNQL